MDYCTMLDIRHPEALDPSCHRLIEELAALDFAPDCYLAGGAALALYLGHRRTRSLDLMGYFRLASSQRRDILHALLAAASDAGVAPPKVETARDGFLWLSYPSADARPMQLRLFYYPYPLIDEERELGGLEVASAVDLGLMKLGALISRGSRRDFVDLYLLCQQVPLEELLRRSGEKFGHVRDFALQALKGLADVSIALEEPMPRLESDVDWPEIETWLRGEVRDIARRHVGLAEAGAAS